jgi:hypothetical protein
VYERGGGGGAVRGRGGSRPPCGGPGFARPTWHDYLSKVMVPSLASAFA